MDTEEEESSSKHSLEEEQDSVTASDAPQELPINAQQCDTELQNLLVGGETAAAPLVTASRGDEDVIRGELSTSMANRDEETDNSVEELPEMKRVVIGADMSAGIKDTVVNEEVDIAVKKGGGITDLADGGCKVEELDNVAPEVKVEDSVELKSEAAEKENAICIADTVGKKAVPMLDEFATEDVSMKVNDGVAKAALADETDMTDIAVETKKMEVEENGAAMPDKAAESEEKVAGTADMADVFLTRSEADGVGIEDNSIKIDDKAEVAEEVNEGGVVDATAEEGAEEEASEVEETEAANEADFASEEADVADMTEDIEAAEEAEEMEVAENQSRRVGGGKRKRGKNPKSTGRVSARKKLEEDVCFICFDGGDLVLCDRRGCPKAYHPSCVNRDEAFFRTKGKWNCEMRMLS